MTYFALLASASLICGLSVAGCASPPADSPPPSRSFTSPSASDLDPRLAEKVSIGGLNQDSIERILPFVLAGSSLKYEIDYEAFRRAGIDLTNRRVMHRPADGIPRSQLLNEVLDQIPATYSLRDNTVRIGPQS